MKREISKKSKHAISSTNPLLLLDPFAIGLVIAIVMGFVAIGCLYSDHQKTTSIMMQYNDLRANPYVTLQENKKIFNQANIADGDANSIIKKMDGTTVVDNKNGHEYLVNVTPSRSSFSNAQYQLIAKTNGKNAVINKAWLKEHKKE